MVCTTSREDIGSVNDYIAAKCDSFLTRDNYYIIHSSGYFL